jgi:hypothetical protein
MCPVIVVIVDVLLHQSLEVSLIEDDDVIEQLPAATSDETFRYPFCHGLGKLVLFGSMPKLLIVPITSSLKLEPRSKIRYLGAVASGNASRSC